ncbi:MAG: D-alanyl-D-alanine carboxypeptidase [Clostridiales bacterium]|nr:D-alanyl-D-alanine carboxypeptidase [Clostridiales bacterium]
MKKIFSVFFIFIICFSFSLSISAFIVSADTKKPEPRSFDVSAKSAYMIDFDSKTVIYSKNENERLPIASMCKIMTLLLCFEELDKGSFSLEDSIVISDTASKMGGSQVFLEANAEYKIGDLIKSIIIASANDSSVAMAEYISGSEELFTKKMNDKVKELGLNNTVYCNATGLPGAIQYSSAKDVAIIFSELLKHEEYFTFANIWMEDFCHPEGRVTGMTNTNKLIRFYEGCDSGKTGYTSEAGHCLTASAKRQNLRLISVVINEPDSKTRFKDVSNMFNYGFATYVNKLIVDNKTPLENKIEVNCAKKDKISIIPKESYYHFSKKDEKSSFDIIFTPIDNLKAPIKKGDKVGELSIYNSNVQITTIDVLANEDINAKNYFDVLKEITLNWSIIS